MTKEQAINILSRPKTMKNAPSDILEAHEMAIQALEQTMWIACSDRLPEKSGEYLCTFGGSGFTGSDYYTTESDAKKIFDEPEEYVGWRSQNVIAWQPLPEPYKAESEVRNADSD